MLDDTSKAPLAATHPAVVAGEGEFATQDGVRLFQRWVRVPQPRAVVTLVHGVLEHSGRYLELGQALGDADISCFAFDLRGHGRSGGERGMIERFDHYVDDLAAFCRHVRGLEPHAPLFLVGHSMGSLISALYAAQQPDLQGIVLASIPAEFVDQPSAPKVFAARLLAGLLPRVRVDPGLDPATLSSNAAVIRTTQTDPLMQERVSLKLAVLLLAAAKTLPERARTIQTPTLLLQGSDDPVGSAAGARGMLGWIGAQDKQLVVFEGLRHELFLENESERARVFATLIDWILHHARKQ